MRPRTFPEDNSSAVNQRAPKGTAATRGPEGRGSEGRACPPCPDPNQRLLSALGSAGIKPNYRGERCPGCYETPPRPSNRSRARTGRSPPKHGAGPEPLTAARNAPPQGSLARAADAGGQEAEENNSKLWEEDSRERKKKKKKEEKEKPNQPYFKKTCFGKHRLTENCTKGDDPSCLGLVLFRLNPPAEVCLPRRRGQLYSTTLGNMR